MEHIEYSWRKPDQSKIYGQGWLPEKPVIAVVCLVHGVGDHSGRYKNVIQPLTQAGFAVMSFDLYGHGKSEGQRGHAVSFEATMDDIAALLEQAERRLPGKPRFLYGHSLGGLLVINFALRRKPTISGVVATSPALRSALQEQKVKLFLVNTLGAFLPRLSLPTGLDVKGISRDPRVLQAYTEDPLVHGVMSLGMAKQTLDALIWANQHATEFPLPLLIVQGSDDPIIYPQGAQDFSAQAPHTTLKIWQGCYHETHNEPEAEQVVAYTLNWLQQHLTT